MTRDVHQLVDEAARRGYVSGESIAAYVAAEAEPTDLHDLLRQALTIALTHGQPPASRRELDDIVWLLGKLPHDPGLSQDDRDRIVALVRRCNQLAETRS